MDKPRDRSRVDGDPPTEPSPDVSVPHVNRRPSADPRDSVYSGSTKETRGLSRELGPSAPGPTYTVWVPHDDRTLIDPVAPTVAHTPSFASGLLSVNEGPPVSPRGLSGVVPTSRPCGSRVPPFCVRPVTGRRRTQEGALGSTGGPGAPTGFPAHNGGEPRPPGDPGASAFARSSSTPPARAPRGPTGRLTRRDDFGPGRSAGAPATTRDPGLSSEDTPGDAGPGEGFGSRSSSPKRATEGPGHGEGADRNGWVTSVPARPSRRTWVIAPGPPVARTPSVRPRSYLESTLLSDNGSKTGFRLVSMVGPETAEVPLQGITECPPGRPS